MKDGETIYHDNFRYRNLATGEAVDSDTIFHIASLTKSFTGASIHRLQADGRLSVEDLITKHLPSVGSRQPTVASMATIADLPGHRTGLQKADNPWLGSDGELLLDKDQTLAFFSQLKPQATFRSGFFYNNIACVVLGEIVSKVSGLPYHLYLQEHILTPLGMTRTLVTKDGDLPDSVSLAYSTLDSE